MRRIGLVLLAAFLALGLASHVQAQPETVEKAAMRDPGKILGGPRHSQAKVERYARRMNSTQYIMRTIPIYYKLAPQRNIAPDVLVAQAMVVHLLRFRIVPYCLDGRMRGRSHWWMWRGARRPRQQWRLEIICFHILLASKTACLYGAARAIDCRA